MRPDTTNDTVTRPAGESASVSSAADDTAGLSSTGPDGDRPSFAPPTAPGELGRLGKYRIQRELGRGGMGAVYLAFDERLERKVALKVMLPKAAANATAKDRFLREARAAARISSDHVVAIYEADETDGVPFIALQYLQGYPLDEYLKKKGPPSLPQVVRLGRETAVGLAAAHKLGLVHRDIKPGNVWLEAPTGRVKILDFGLAKPVVGKEHAELTASGTVVGTPAYMAPEQGLGRPLDGRADLFSLGCMLYRLVTGRLPFEGPTVMAILTAIATQDPPPVRTLNPLVPEQLADLIHRLLAKNPADRPATAAQVVKELDAIGTATRKPAEVSPDAPTIPQQQVVYTPMAVSEQQNNPFEHLADEESAEEPPPPKPAAMRGKPRPWPLIVAGVLAALGLAAVGGFIIIKITNKDGTTTEIKVPEGTKLEVSKDGKPVVTVTPDGKVTALPTLSGPPPVKATAPRAAAGLPAGKSALRFAMGDVATATKVPVRPTTLVTIEAWMTFEAVQEAGGRELIRTPNGSINTNDSRLGFYSFHGGAGAKDLIPKGRRVHVAGVNDGKKRHLYLDGKQVAESEDAGEPIPENEQQAAGEKGTMIALGSDLFTGTIDAVRVSTTARYEKEFTPPAVFAKDKDTFALYLFDEGQGDTLKDSSGNGYHGKIIGAKWVKGVGSAPSSDGMPGLRIDEKDGFRGAEVPTLKLTGDGPLTLEGYVKIEHQRVVENPTFFGWNYQYTVGIGGEATVGLCQFTAGENGAQWKQNPAAVADTLPRGAWHHLAAVRDGKQNRLYIDGKLVAKEEVAEPILSAGDHAGLFVIGSICDGVTLREVRVSKAARYSGDKFAPAARHEPDKDTLALYHCDDGQGDVLTDSSGNNHHGKINGGKWVTASVDRDRQVAEWVLSVNGKCVVQVNDKNTECTALDQLPAGEFKLIDASIAHEHSTDANVARFAGLRNLAFLTLVGGTVTDQGVAKLRDLPRLMYLNLHGTKVTDAGLPGPKELPELNALILIDTAVTDAGLAALTKLPKLQGLVLNHTAVTDEGLQHLRAAPGLTQVSVLKTKVTEAGVRQLAAALPGCKIEWDGGVIEPKK